MNTSKTKPLFARLCAALFAAAILLSTSPAATLVGDYQLQGTYSSSVGTIGDLTLTGTNAAFVPDTVNGQPQQVLQLNTNSAAVETGVQAQTSGFLSPTNYSVSLLAEYQLSLANPVATKIFDFKKLTSDDGLYVNTTGSLAFVGAPTPLLIGPSLTPGEYTQIVLTRDGGTKATNIYANGVSVFSFIDTGDVTVLQDGVLNFFKDDGGGLGGPFVNETTVGYIARIQLFDGALSPSEVADLPASAPIPEPSTFAVGIALLGVVVSNRRRRRA